MNPSVKQFSIDRCGSLGQLIMQYVCHRQSYEDINDNKQ